MAAPLEPRSTFVDTGHHRLHVAQWGEPAAPTVLLQHGLRDHARSWDWVAQTLALRFHVVAPDLRGHGDSGWTEPGGYTLAAYVMDLSDIVAALGLNSFALVGHSLGGAIALRYAGAFPDKLWAMCGIECIELPIVRDQRREPVSFARRLSEWTQVERARRGRVARVYPTLDDARARMAEGQETLDDATIDHVVRHGVMADPNGGWRWKFDNAARFRPPDDADGQDLDECLAAISCPILLAYGEKSWIPVPPVERLRLLHDYRLVTFPSASHWLHHQARAEFQQLLQSFLAATNESASHA
jgi:pimeloyl-ACP methyl ester carboxylesterase